jgi:RNA ligase
MGKIKDVFVESDGIKTNRMVYLHHTRTEVTNMSTVFRMSEYDAALAAGHIKTRLHETFPYVIHGYTESCVWERAWNSATLTCRGLITHADTGEIIARPFPKFFNLGQVEETNPIDFNTPVEVTEKMDGSLGILYPTSSGGWAVSTRGSFHSEQADWATEFYNRNHAGFEPNRAWTYLFEIIYPKNRIVLSYDFEGLVLIGAVDIATGASISIREAAVNWEGPVAATHPYRSLNEVIASGERDDAEGFVALNLETGVRVKIKHAAYIQLHKYLTGTTEKHVWEVLSRGENLAVAFATAPDEFHQWARIIGAGLGNEVETQRHRAVNEFTSISGELDTTYGPDGWGRREFAALALKTINPALMFTLLDGKDITSSLWAGVKPVGENTYGIVTL